MKTLHLVLFLSLFWACSQSDSNPDGNSMAESSVMAGFDRAAPQASFHAMAAGASESRIQFEVHDLDLKEVYQNQEFPVEFPFKVEGKDDVVFTGLETSCGCTNVYVEVNGEKYVLNEIIPAGSQGILHATFTSAKYRKEKNSVITLRGNAANLPEKLTLYAFVKPVFEYEPSQVRFGDVMAAGLREEDPVKVIKVIAKEPFEVKKWRRLPKGVTITDTGRVETGANGMEQYRWFEVKLGEDVNPGILYQSAIAETTLGDQMEIVVHANVVGPVKYFPEQRLWFGTVNQGQTPVRVLKVVATMDEIPLVVPEVIFEGADVFKVVTAEKTPGKEFVVRVKMNGDAPLGRHGGTLKLIYPEGSTFKNHQILVSAIVRKAP